MKHECRYCKQPEPATVHTVTTKEGDRYTFRGVSRVDSDQHLYLIGPDGLALGIFHESSWQNVVRETRQIEDPNVIG